MLSGSCTTLRVKLLWTTYDWLEGLPHFYRLEKTTNEGKWSNSVLVVPGLLHEPKMEVKPHHPYHQFFCSGSTDVMLIRLQFWENLLVYCHASTLQTIQHLKMFGPKFNHVQPYIHMYIYICINYIYTGLSQNAVYIYTGLSQNAVYIYGKVYVEQPWLILDILQEKKLDQ